MSLVPAVTELLLAELMYLQYDNPTKPIFMYINSAGVQVSVPQSISSNATYPLPMASFTIMEPAYAILSPCLPNPSPHTWVSMTSTQQ